MLGVLATLAAGLFAGAAVYISVVEHPARMECGVHVAVRQFRPSYRRAAVVQAALAAIGCLLGVAAWLGSAAIGWLVGAILLGAVIPFTLVVIRPTNKQILGEHLDLTSPLAEELLTRWGQRHAVRSGLSLVAFIIFASLLTLSPS